MDSGEREIGLVATTIINPREEYLLRQGSNQETHVLQSNTQTNELHVHGLGTVL